MSLYVILKVGYKTIYERTFAEGELMDESFCNVWHEYINTGGVKYSEFKLLK
jgi:hypothetical protein